MKRQMLFFILLLLPVFIIFSEDKSDSEDIYHLFDTEFTDEWKNNFLNELNPLLENSFIPFTTIGPIISSIKKDELPENAAEAALLFFSAVKKADIAIRKGISQGRVLLETKQALKLSLKGQHPNPNNKSVRNRLRSKNRASGRNTGKNNNPGNEHRNNY